MLLSGAVFVEAVGIGVLFPLLARVQAAHHLPTYGLGLMSGASFFGSLISQLAVAPWLDGRRARPVLLVGLLIGFAAPLVFAESSHLWMLTLARALGGISSGIVVPAALRAGTSGVPPERRGARLGLLTSAQMAGIVLGPLVAVGFYAVGGLALPFEAVAVAAAVLLVALAVTPGAGAVAVADVPDVDLSLPGRPRVGRSQLAAVLLIAVASQLPNGFYDALWSRLLTDRGASTFLIGMSLALFGIPFVILAPIGGRLAGRQAPLLWASAGLVVAAGFMASYGFVVAPVAIVILGIFESCAQSIVVPGGYAAVASVFPDRSAATGQGWFSGAGTAAAGVAAVAAAPLYAAFGSGPVFAGGASVSAAAALVAAFIWVRSSPARVAGWRPRWPTGWRTRRCPR